ncbi:MAG TPA: DinB family protein [Mycobacteriales bacterium]|nr:DinB family protein [Mycobacteriales bacterium]
MAATPDRVALLERYDDGARAVRAALAEATDAELDRRAADGWSARQVVHHLADSEMTSAIRLRRLLCEESPVLSAYDEEEFARRLHYDVRPIEPSLAALEAARRTSSDILRLAGEADWSRAGTHSESGAYSVDDWLATYAVHAHDHADQIRRALGR